MAKKNFSVSTVATAPSPTTTGTSLIVEAGHGARFAEGEVAVICPANTSPDSTNAEIVLVTDVTTDTLTITREQESTTARDVQVGDVIFQQISAADWNAIVAKVATVEENADVTDAGNVGSSIHEATAKTTPVDADTVPLIDSEASNALKKVTWANIKATLKTYFDSVTTTLTNKTLTSPVINTGVSGTAVLDEDNMASDSATKLATQQSIKAYADTKIPNSIKSGNGDSVATVDSADIEGEYLVKFDADGNITDSGLHSGDILPYKDEDNMASDSNVHVPTQQSVKAYVDNRGSNSFQVDQSGGTSDTYGVLSGSVNGTNTTFTVSLGSYVSGSLQVYLNGQLQTQGTAEDWDETTPASGTFDFNTAPQTGDLITVVYQFTTGTTGNADTLDGSHLADIIDTIYPVGSIYISTVSTNPATLFGRGTWSAFGAGKTLVGLDSGDTNFDTAEETGGAKTVTLETANLPSHRHSVNITSGTQSANHNHKTGSGSLHTASGSAERKIGSDPTFGPDVTDIESATHTHNVSGNTGYIGSGTAVTNLQPYIVVYIWKRTA